jgi:hypothetical protein
MAFLQCEGHGGLLDAWVAERGVGPTRPAALVDDSVPGLRFAFYGRASTADHQDSASSRGWQREIAEAVIAGHGVVTDVFFDVGCSRRVPWARRPAAGALLAALRMERRFDAVVVGEYECASSPRVISSPGLQRLRRPGRCGTRSACCSRSASCPPVAEKASLNSARLRCVDHGCGVEGVSYPIMKRQTVARHVAADARCPAAATLSSRPGGPDGAADDECGV